MPKDTITTVNREVSWLHFNGRVLQEAADPRNPVVERLRFLGIFSNNRDEFFRVRVATLNRMMKVRKNEYGMDVNPRKTLKLIVEIVQNQEKEFMRIYGELVKELRKYDICIIDEQELDDSHGRFVRQYFQEKVRGSLFPIMIGSLRDISSLRDRSIYLAVTLSGSGSRKTDFALIELPTKHISRFLELPRRGKRKYIILLDDVIRYCLSDIFSVFGYTVFSAYTIKITRDAEIDIDTDVSKSFLEVMTQSLKQRKQGTPVRFVYDNAIPQELLKLITRKLWITKDDPVRGGGRYHNFKDFMGFPFLGNPDLVYDPLPPLPGLNLPADRSILACIRKKDIMLHFPYQSFRYMIDLVREASIDPEVRSIKMTIYRVARDSGMVNALINASRNGKNVTVFMELMARFDEEANIYWTERLREEGVKVIQSIPGFKVHCKLLLIRRKEAGKNVLYASIGTGNFNEDTARVYADESLLTANQKICADVASAFDMMEATFRPHKFRELIMAPYYMRNHFIKLLNREIRNAREKKEAWVILKLNNLVDEAIVRKLYKAGQAGVKIRMIIRGICVLIPGMENISGNIEGISIVDRFLEHSRVLIFCNGGDNLYYITSADWMVRNFDNRIEVACPIYDKEIREELRTMIDIQLRDNVKARIIGPGEPNQYRSIPGKAVRSQVETYRFFKNKLIMDN